MSTCGHMEEKRVIRIIVTHGSYGCDTGCCGHYIEVYDGSGAKVDQPAPAAYEYSDPPFTADHPATGGDQLAWAKDLVREQFGAEHVADLDWDNCLVSSE